MLEEILNRFDEMHQRATVKTVFGDPYQVNGRTIVPVAKASFGFGFGGGQGTMNANGSQGDREAGVDSGGSAGGGGGGYISARPVAVLELGPDGTKVKPIVDVARIALVAMALAAWNVFWITYTIRRVRAQ